MTTHSPAAITSTELPALTRVGKRYNTIYHQVFTSLPLFCVAPRQEPGCTRSWNKLPEAL